MKVKNSPKGEFFCAIIYLDNFKGESKDQNMTAIILYVMIVLILTKLLDIVSTLKKIQSPMHESNPFIRKIMLQIGTKGTIWLVFLVAVVIIFIAGFLAMIGGRLMKGVFVLAGLFVAVVQVAVVLLAVIFLVSNLVVDILYTVVDPRIRYD